jgi:hypothetical protein
MQQQSSSSLGNPNAGKHCIATIKYPNIPQPIPPQKVFVVLAKARESFTQLTFQWTVMPRPKAGDCHLELKSVVPSEGAPFNPASIIAAVFDGCDWKGPVKRERVVVGPALHQV